MNIKGVYYRSSWGFLFGEVSFILIMGNKNYNYNYYNVLTVRWRKN